MFVDKFGRIIGFVDGVRVVELDGVFFIVERSFLFEVEFWRHKFFIIL